ncbi:MAG: UDP-2,4-diacetamido-2,4,6-trideoxy-beta-L-altropyranose hydrolase [Paraglaciecola sp.]|uniref:UDP-2,4-diacetamido-2,4, 6-trideoxy-beta-L-altropyranose hydrolase n=1 Tax=Paraglaciecola sp. TaxID=1920173 RepID=UPI003297C766
MSRRVLFRVDASPIIGLGHLMRSLALAQGLSREGIEVMFAVSDFTEQYCFSRQDWVGDIHILPVSSKQAETAALSTLCKDTDANWLILDGYQFDFEYRNTLGAVSCKLGIFDDGEVFKTQRIEPDLDMLINWAPAADCLHYEQYAPNAQLCVGEYYRVLREEFCKSEPISYELRRPLLLMFGGSDPFNFTLPLLQQLTALGVDIPITIVTGAGYQALPELDLFLDTSSLFVTHHHNSQDIARLMSAARLAISAAGASQFELLSCLTPSILVTVANNQIFATQQAKKQGWCEVFNYRCAEHEHLIKDIVQAAVNLWENPEKLNLMHQHTKEHANQMGIKRIIEAMF